MEDNTYMVFKLFGGLKILLNKILKRFVKQNNVLELKFIKQLKVFGEKGIKRKFRQKFKEI